MSTACCQTQTIAFNQTAIQESILFIQGIKLSSRASRIGPIGFVTVCCALMVCTTANRADAQTPKRSPADVPELGTYVHLFGALSIGDSLRFNNPFRLEHQLGESGESLSITPPYSSVAFAAALGDPDGPQHGASFHWSYALTGLPQHVVTPSYLFMLGGPRPWLIFGRAGLPIIVNPDPNAGGELALGGAYMLTAGLGLQAELIGNIFYGAATWEKKITIIPMLSAQLGVLVDYEVLP